MLNGLKKVLVLTGCAVLLATPAPALAKVQWAQSPKQAHRVVVRAEHQLAHAKAVLAEARHIESATRYYSKHDYSDFARRWVEPGPVGRWVWLARDTGWTWGDVDMLLHIIARESSGNPSVRNGSGSGATGLLQWMPDWYNGTWHTPFDPTNPRESLAVGVEVHAKQGWAPWAL